MEWIVAVAGVIAALVAGGFGVWRKKKHNAIRIKRELGRRLRDAKREGTEDESSAAAADIVRDYHESVDRDADLDTNDLLRRLQSKGGPGS